MLRLLAVWLAVCGNALAPQRKRAPQRPRGQGTDATQTQASADAAQTQALTDAARPRARAALSRKAAPPAVPRRVWLRSVAGLAVASSGPAFANDEYFDDRPDLQEVSGLVVLRVAEVAAFQEQLLREVAKGTDLGVPVTPQQFMFGTELLLRNSNLDGNMKLMIATEIPKAKREAAIKQAPRVMNALLAISAEAAKVETPQLRPKDASALADLYRQLRGELLAMFAFLPEDLQSKYQGYATVLSKYEKDISCTQRLRKGTSQSDRRLQRPRPRREAEKGSQGSLPKGHFRGWSTGADSAVSGTTVAGFLGKLLRLP
ncbi:hypothetical protein M885DRAFT_439564 [Pelagophyceae sp. CCMP2097]|nr:hypothetical protein M885DRAFT_439564 [Pelagophyceae sp. CCMP2097]